MIIYKNNSYIDYVELFISLSRLGEEIHESIFPTNEHFYIRSHLQEKFPNQKFTIGEVKQILNEELALKTITLKDEKGLESASSLDILKKIKDQIYYKALTSIF